MGYTLNSLPALAAFDRELARLQNIRQSLGDVIEKYGDAELLELRNAGAISAAVNKTVNGIHSANVYDLAIAVQNSVGQILHQASTLQEQRNKAAVLESQRKEAQAKRDDEEAAEAARIRALLEKHPVAEAA